MGRTVERLNKSLKQKHKDYERQLYQSYLTVPEWRNVEMAEELGKFLKEGNAFYQYPYFRQIADLWALIIKSYRKAREHHSHWTLLTSEYMVMNIFVGCFTTASFAYKGLISLLMAPLLNAKNQSPLQREVAAIVSEYGANLHHTPFYNFPYRSKVKPLWQAFRNTKNKSIADYVTFGTAFAELFARIIVSWPIGYYYNQPQNTSAVKVHVLVKTKNKRPNYKKFHKDIELLGTHTKKTIDDRFRYQHLTTPRYEEFKDIAQAFVDNDIQIKKISGQGKIQFKVEVPQDEKLALESAKILYSYQNHLSNSKTVLLDVQTKDFNKAVKELNDKQIKIRFMHDF